MKKSHKGKKSHKNKKHGGVGNVVKFQRGPQFSRNAIGLPAARTVTMRYVESFNIASTTGSLATYEWGANDLFDPNITGGGHQPYGFDQWVGTFYNKATVMKSQIHAHVASNGVPILFGVYFARSTASSTISTATGLLETGRGTGTLVSGSSAPTKSVRSNWNIRITDPDFDPGSFFCTASAGPTFRYHFGIASQPMDLGSSVNAVGYVVIEYTVLLEDPITLASS